MEQSYKICPRCDQPATLDATLCQKCGRQYRTQFVQPEQTQFISNPPNAQKFLPAKAFAVLCVIAVALLLSGFVVNRWLRPYPFVSTWNRGQWIITAEGVSDTPTTLKFYRDGTGEIIARKYGDGLRNDIDLDTIQFKWHILGDKMMMGVASWQVWGEVNDEKTWAVSSDGEIFSLGDEKYKRGEALPPPSNEKLERIKAELRAADEKTVAPEKTNGYYNFRNH